MLRRQGFLGVAAAVIAALAIVVVGIVWPGLDAKRTPPADSSVWALQTGDGFRYARVNTAIDELDTVRSVANPTAVAQTGDDAYVFSESWGKVTPIDAALPDDLDDDAVRESPRTPDGTVEAAMAGDFVAYRTDTGAVYAGTLSDGGGAARLEPFTDGDGEEAAEYEAEAIAVDDAGTLYSWSQDDGAVLRYRIPTGEVAGRDPVRDPPTGTNLKMTAAGGVWFLIDARGDRIWRRGADGPASVELDADAVAGVPSAGGSNAYVADLNGLVELPAGGEEPRRIFGNDTRDLGIPARPRQLDGVVYAAWLGPGEGVLWRSDDPRGETRLAYGAKGLDEDRRPIFTASDTSMILNETRTGWVWSVPDGRLLPSSENWLLDERDNPQSEESDRQAAVMIDPRPPVAEPDAFGVRAGSLAALPVMLNDHDPNEDVLSIDPASVTGLDPEFGTVAITDNGQRLAVEVAPGASGSATISYRVTDGTAGDGLASDPTTATVAVTPGSQNTAPEWCPTAGCLAVWPEPEVAAGGTVSIPVLNGWVDAEGDPVILLSATDDSGLGVVAATPAGDVVYQHDNASPLTEPQAVTLQVTVADTRGGRSVKSLVVRVSPEPEVAAESFTVMDTQGAGLTVDVADHVTGTVGSLSLESVRVLDDAPAEAVATAGSTSFDFSADRPGSYRVAYTVTDGKSEGDATARITVLPSGAPAQLATAPVVAFVHPREDVTVDVFSAVSNPTRRVLLLSDVRPAAAPGASMSVDVVGQNFLRVSGATADGAEGPLGTVRYTISDGTDDAGARIEGEATVYLLPPAPDLAPIAVNDAIAVRAGAQVDIPVLDNDVAVAGGTITLNPAGVRSLQPEALAFGSGRSLRYLAPDEPGSYTVEYSVFSAGSPALADAATVSIDVIEPESNRAPRPETLEGRVLSGEATSIPFRSFGVDPDGDDVSLDRITSQPVSGSATISADGESIVYTSAPGFHGQVQFDYRVSDGSGETGAASVRVGVLDEEANPSPVTFTDYVQVQAGETNTVRVSPIANDIDPTGGTMSVTDVRPDLVDTLTDGSDNPEYARLDGLLGAQTDTQVVIAAGEDPGTMSFLYDVESSSGNTARGLIVVKVVRESVPDYPVITDTVLTAETRDRFPDGVDVVADQVSWSGGDISDLRLSLWGDPDAVTVDGTDLRGPVPSRTRIIPFALTGDNAAGEEVTSYGFLRIPGDDDLTLALRAGLPPRQVNESESVSWDMTALVSAPRGRGIEVGGELETSGARSGAACVRESGTTLRYDAGAGAPWADACIVPVRLTGQSDYTFLSVPVRIIASEPQPELKAASLTVGPGQSATYDLRTMTTWQGGTDWGAIAYALEYAGADFTVSVEGSVVTITGEDRAVPGSEEVAVVGVTSHPDVAPARLLLRVGAAPSNLPQGGTVTTGCSQASGNACTFDVVGGSGEVNPLPRTPLELVGVRGTGACVGVSFAVASATAVTASWTSDAPGATCTASFSLRDAQGRVTAGDRDGELLLDLQGYPQGPASLSQAAYGNESVTLRVDPGQSRLAYPALRGFYVRYQGQVVATCGPDGACPAISAPNGDERVYEASAFNAVGESRARVVTTAWAYEPPPAPESITAEPVVTGGEGGYIALQIDGLDPIRTGYVEISSATGETVQVGVSGDSSIAVPRYRVGSNTLTPVTVTPYSRFPIPPGLDGSVSGAARTIDANGIGAPVGPVLTLGATPNGDGTSTVSATATATINGDGSAIRYGIVPEDENCRVSDTGGTATFRVDDGSEYAYRMCAESVYDGTQFGRAEAVASVRAVQSDAVPQGWTFVVDGTPDVSSASARWTIKQAPTSGETPPRNNVAEFRNWPGNTVFDRNPEIGVRYVHRDWGPTTDYAEVTPAPGSAPYQVQASWQVSGCGGGAALSLTSSSTEGRAAVSFDTSGAAYYDQIGAVIAPDPNGLVPIGAVRVDGIRVTVDWSAQGWGLSNATDVFGATCAPNIPLAP